MVIASAAILANSMSVALPLLLTQRASAIAPQSQSFESDTAGWTSGGSYGTITQTASGTNGIPSASGSSHAVVTGTGSGPYTYFNGRSSVWTGTWTSEIDVYLDPSWAVGSGFEYSVAATKKDNNHLRDFVFHVTKDTSTDSLLVAGSNNAAPSPREDLETINHHVVTAAGWYTLRHTFRDQGGALAVDLQLEDSTDTVLFTETRTNAADLIASVVGGNRYGWFTDVTIPSGLAIDNVALSGTPAPVVNINTNEEFTNIKTAVEDSDTANGHTLEVRGSLTASDNTVVNKDITIRGISGATINTSGGLQLLTITAAGATVEDLTFIKTDKTSVAAIIGVQANDITIRGNSFTGQYVLGEGEVARAIVVSPSRTNATISDNSFSGLRQPAYLDPLSAGSVNDNYVTGTRGWVVSKDSNFSFTGNTWGTNAVDIAIIIGHDPVDPTPELNNYTCQIGAIKAANNNPVIQDQAPAPISSCPNTAPLVTFETPTPAEGSTVGGVITPHVLATDDHGMGSYYIRLWKGSFESGSANLVRNDCYSAPGAFSLGTVQDITCPAIDTATLEDGTYVLSAQFQDGHIAWGQALRTFTVNNAPPAVPTNLSWTPEGGSAVTSGSITSTQKGTLSWLNSDTSVDRYKYYFWTDIPGYFEDQANAWTTEGPTYITKSPIGGAIWTDFYSQQGTYFFCVKAVNISGNSSDCSETFSITYDTTIPNPPANLRYEGPAVACGGFTNINWTTAAWNSVAGATSYDYEALFNGSVVYSNNFAGTSNTGSFGGGQNGAWAFRVRSVGANGLKSDWTTVCEITLDTNMPSVPTILNPSSEQYFNSTPILNKWTASTDTNGVAGYQVAYRYDDGHSFGGSTCPDEIISGLAVSGCRDEAGTQRSHVPGIIEQGGVTIWVRAIDAAGNKSAWSTPVHYYYDATPPAAPTISISETSGDVIISGYTNSYGVITSWPAVAGADGYQYRYSNSIPSDAYNAPNYYEVLGASTSVAGVFNRGEGLHHIQVRAYDNAGNWSGWSNVLNVVYDATAPIANITSHPDGETVAGPITLTGEVTDVNPSDSSFRITGPSGYDVTDSYTDGRAVHDLAWDTSGLADGDYTIIFKAVDKAGNESSETIVLTVDNTAPTLTINPLVPSANATPTITGTVDDPTAEVKISINGGAPASALVSGNTWSYTVTTPLSTGVHNITASAVDAMNNSTNPETASYEVTEGLVESARTDTPSTPAPTNTSNLTSPQTVQSTPSTNSGSRSSEQGDVLSAETEETTTESTDETPSESSQSRTLAATDENSEAADANKGCSKILGICWYWWIPIVVIILGTIYYFSSRRSDEK